PAVQGRLGHPLHHRRAEAVGGQQMQLDAARRSEHLEGIGGGERLRHGWRDDSRTLRRAAIPVGFAPRTAIIAPGLPTTPSVATRSGTSAGGTHPLATGLL